MSALLPPPLSLYIHIPWCKEKCPYCDFNSHKAEAVIPEQQYVEALLADLEQELGDIWGRSIHSIFIGGGTPSLLSPETLDLLLSGLRARLNMNSLIEITMEANPGTIDNARFADFVAVGINRLSIGVQSFNDPHLQKLGRIHDRKTAIAAIELAHKCGFENINLDLMFALPQQTPRQALSDLQTAIDLEPHHLSYYQLTLEPNTEFFAHPPTLPNDDESLEIQEQGIALMAANGYERYEISAYAKDQNRCQHNMNYWQFGDYLGIGAGAHGKLSFAADGRILRRNKKRQPKAYLNALSTREFIHQQRELDAEDRRFEFFLNTLRLTSGTDLDSYEQRTGLDRQGLESAIDIAVTKQLLQVENNSITPTDKGLLFLNDLLEIFLPSSGDS